jgi:hypothetical protein
LNDRTTFCGRNYFAALFTTQITKTLHKSSSSASSGPHLVLLCFRFWLHHFCSLPTLMHYHLLSLSLFSSAFFLWRFIIFVSNMKPNHRQIVREISEISTKLLAPKVFDVVIEFGFGECAFGSI